MIRDLADGEETSMQGSAKAPYVLRNVGGVYSCSCPAWRNQGQPIDLRTCKHLKKLRGEEAEAARVGVDAVRRGPVKKKTGTDDAEKPPVLLAHSWEVHEDPTGWWMSEKLDGVRAYWDGKQFVSRLGNRYLAPAWFTAHLPEFPLDGELWVGRGEFQQTVSIVRRVKGGEAWKSVRYVVFDAPQHAGPFEERLSALEGLFPETADYVEVLSHDVCEGLEHMQRELARIESLGGEGLMLRKPSSRYEAGRSSTLLKVKTFHDAEARVTEHVPGKGKHKGKLGALKVVTPGGIEFSVGTGFSDAQRRDPPAVGDIITYRYQELSNRGVPRFPSFVRLREDADWASLEAEAPQPARKAQQKPALATPAAPTASAPPASAAGGAGRMFEYEDGKSSKFWEIACSGAEFTVRYGRIGAAGRNQTKSFASEDAARAAAEKLIAQKVGKGYVERTAAASAEPTGEQLPDEPGALTILIPDSLSATEAGERYEQPVEELVDALELGEVLASGVRKKRGKVLAFTLDLEVESVVEAVRELRQLLTELGAPAKTTLKWAGKKLPLSP